MKVIGITDKIPHKIHKIARNTRRWILKKGQGRSEGFCGEASDRIIEKLEDIGIDAVFCDGTFLQKGNGLTHCWIKIPKYNDAILDVTADQFNHCIKHDGIKMGAIVFSSGKEVRQLYCSFQSTY